jgi:hypothetical protein
MKQDKHSERLKKFGQKHFKELLYGKASSRAVFTVLGLSLREFKASFPQFFSWSSPISSFFRCVKYALLALARIPLGRSVRLSYAYTGEDRIIESLLKPLITENGFYVDIGCNDPRFISNTFLLYKRGWRGICVDANESLIKKHKKIRPRDKAMSALISNEEKEMEFVELTNNVLSSTDSRHLTEWINQGQKVVSKKIIRTKTLTQVLDELQAPSSFDLLSIDIEELDLMALQSLDLKKYQPKLIVVEAEDFDAENPKQHPIYHLLSGQGYHLAGYILTNLYFLRN